MADLEKNKGVYKDRYVYRKDFAEKQLLDQLYVKKLLSVQKRTSPDILYSDMVKRAVKSKIASRIDSKVITVNKKCSKIVKSNDKNNLQVHGEVSSAHSRLHGVDTSMESVKCNLETSSKTKPLNAYSSVNQNHKVVNIRNQDCDIIVDTNRFAILYVDSSEDEGDSLDSLTVKDSDASSNGKKSQSGQSVVIHGKLGKTSSNFGKKSFGETSEQKFPNQNKRTYPNIVPNAKHDPLQWGAGRIAPLPNRPSANRPPKKVGPGQIGPIKIQPWTNRTPAENFYN